MLFRSKKIQSLSLELKQFFIANFEVFILFLLFCIAGTLIGIYRYNNYLDGFDFTVFREAIWKYAHFMWPDSSIRGLNHVEGDHFHPIIILLAPIYFLFGSPYTLIFIQAFFVALSIFPVYLFAKRKLITRLSALLATVLYILSAGLQWMLFFDFHEILFAVPLIAWSIYFIDKRTWTPLVVTLLLLAVTKEEMYIYIFTVGVLLFVMRWNVKLGAITSAFGLLGFIFLNMVIMPLLAGHRSFGYWSYTTYGSSLGNALINSLRDPLKTATNIIRDFTTPDARLTLAMWLKPLLYFIPVISPYFLLAIPLILTKFLSDFQSYSVHTFHYGGPLAPIFVMAFIDGLSRLATLAHRFMKFPQSRIIDTYIPLVLVLGVLISFNITTRFSSPFMFIRDGSIQKSMSASLKDESSINAIIGKEASLLTPDTVAAHFADRKKIHALLPYEKWDNPTDKIINPVRPTAVDYVLFNTNLPPPDYALAEQRGQAYVYDLYHRKLLSIGFTVVYENPQSGWRLYENSRLR